MHAFNLVLLFMAAGGLYLCGFSVKAIYLYHQGRPVLGTDGKALPLELWPLVLFFGLMAIASSLPGLFGQPMWLLDKVFSVIARLLGT
jgi:hypothetical protein